MIAEKRELFFSFLPGCLSCRVVASRGRYGECYPSSNFSTCCITVLT